jgi:conjugal transfer pilin signal peptidase TrbI
MIGRPRVLLQLIALVLAAGLVAEAGSERYALGIDRQRSRCLPWTLYLLRRDAAEPRRGDYYAFHALGLAPHLRDGTTLVKQVAGVPGDRVRVERGGVRVNGAWRGGLDPHLLAALNARPSDLACDRVLAPGEYFLLGSAVDSYDSRYWGTVRADQLIGRATPLW